MARTTTTSLSYTFILVVISFGTNLALGVETNDLKIVVAQNVVQRCATIAAPFTVKGVQQAGAQLPVIGTIRAQIGWTAVVTNPRINITPNAATFVADVAVHAGPLQYQDQVTGSLKPVYDKKHNRVVFKTENVVLKLKLQQGNSIAAAMVNISDEIPDVEIPVKLPSPVFKLSDQTVRVELNPDFTYVEGALVIASSVKLVTRNRRRRP